MAARKAPTPAATRKTPVRATAARPRTAVKKSSGTAGESKRYERTISKEEAKEQYLLIEKRSLGLFPPLLQVFPLRAGGRELEGRIESYACTCRGPELPHEHFFVRCTGLVPGNKAVVSRGTDGRYSLTIT